MAASPSLAGPLLRPELGRAGQCSGPAEVQLVLGEWAVWRTEPIWLLVLGIVASLFMQNPISVLFVYAFYPHSTLSFLPIEDHLNGFHVYFLFAYVLVNFAVLLL